MAKTGYEIKVPAGTAAAFSTRLAAASPDELASLKWYTVRRGESIATIARKLSVSRADLAEANQLSLTVAGAPGTGPDHPARARPASSRPRPARRRRTTVASRAITGTAAVAPTRAPPRRPRRR